jgi:hypothetical protein
MGCEGDGGAVTDEAAAQLVAEAVSGNKEEKAYL